MPSHNFRCRCFRKSTALFSCIQIQDQIKGTFVTAISRKLSVLITSRPEQVRVRLQHREWCHRGVEKRNVGGAKTNTGFLTVSHTAGNFKAMVWQQWLVLKLLQLRSVGWDLNNSSYRVCASQCWSYTLQHQWRKTLPDRRFVYLIN